MRKATIRFVVCLSVCLSVFPSVGRSVRMEQRCFCWTDFHEIGYFSIFRKSFDKIKLLLKSYNNNSTLH